MRRRWDFPDDIPRAKRMQIPGDTAASSAHTISGISLFNARFANTHS